jgi:hypothetical protein
MINNYKTLDDALKDSKCNLRHLYKIDESNVNGFNYYCNHSRDCIYKKIFNNSQYCTFDKNLNKELNKQFLKIINNNKPTK